MNEEMREIAQDAAQVLGVNGATFGLVTFTSIEAVLKILLLSLTCVWTGVKIYKLIKK
tara:strand:- start:880 stop:1053 length:174 start_codon:yes stop_codon:yes gene_type:complete